MYCTSCGKQVQEGTLYCQFCGKALPNNTSQPLPPTPPQTFQTPTTSPAPSYQRNKPSHTARNAVIGVFLAIVIIAAVIIVFIPGGISGITVPGVSKPSTITVSGTVTTTGTGTSPERLTFTNLINGATYVASANGKTYSIALPNENSYSVTITWKFLGITGGTADAGTLNLNTWQSSMTENWTG